MKPVNQPLFHRLHALRPSENSPVEGYVYCNRIFAKKAQYGLNPLLPKAIRITETAGKSLFTILYSHDRKTPTRRAD